MLVAISASCSIDEAHQSGIGWSWLEEARPAFSGHPLLQRLTAKDHSSYFEANALKEA
jgi:hypothetical protein